MTPHQPEAADEQPPLFEQPEPPEEQQRPTLDALITTARVQATKQSDGGAVGAVVRRLAEADGALAVATLRAEGYPDEAIAAALVSDGQDKRKKPRARIGVVSEIPVVWLTTTGWAAAGKTSRRERHPDAETTAHASAPGEIAGWLSSRLAPWPAMRVSVATGEPVRAWSEQVKAAAWGRIQGAGDTTGAFGALTGGIHPDALLVERWREPNLYANAWGHQPASPEDAAEQVLGLEVELAEKRDEPLGWKVRRWAAALDLGTAYGVVWVVCSREVADNLTALGVGTDAHPRQFLVSGHAVGLKGEPLDDLAATWWPLRLTTGEPA